MVAKSVTLRLRFAHAAQPTEHAPSWQEPGFVEQMSKAFADLGGVMGGEDGSMPKTEKDDE